MPALPNIAIQIRAIDIDEFKKVTAKSNSHKGIYKIGNDEVRSYSERIVATGYYGENHNLRSWTKTQLKDSLSPIKIYGVTVKEKRKTIWELYQKYISGEFSNVLNTHYRDRNLAQKAEYHDYCELDSLLELACNARHGLQCYLVYTSVHSQEEAEMLTKFLNWVNTQTF